MLLSGLQTVKVRPEDRDEYIYKKNLCVFASEFLLITVLQYV